MQTGPVAWAAGELLHDPFRARYVEFGEYAVGPVRFGEWGRSRLNAPLGPSQGLQSGRARIWSTAGAQATHALLRRNPLSDGFVARLEPWKAGESRALEIAVARSVRTWRFRPLVDGEPVPRASVIVRRRIEMSAWPARVGDRGGEWPPELNESMLSAAHRLETNSEGVVEIDSLGLLPTLFVKFDRDGHEPQFGSTLGPQDWRRVDELIDIPLRATPRIERGVVLDDAGAPIEGARVTIAGAQRAPFERVTDASGGFEFETLFPGAPRIEVRAPRHFDGLGASMPGVEPRVFVLARQAAVRGSLRVDDPRGPVDLNLLLLRHEGDTANDKLPGQTLGCSCDGEFSFDALQPGRYTLIVRRARSGANPLELATIERFEVKRGETHDLGEIVIR